MIVRDAAPFPDQHALVQDLCALADAMFDRAWLVRRAGEARPPAPPGAPPQVGALEQAQAAAADALDRRWEQFEARCAATLQAGVFIPWIHLANLFRLDRHEQGLLLCALLPDLDGGYRDALQALAPREAADGDHLPLPAAALLLADERRVQQALMADAVLAEWRLAELAPGSSVAMLSGAYRVAPAITAYLLLKAAPQLRLDGPLPAVEARAALDDHLVDDAIKQQLSRFVAHYGSGQEQAASYLLHLQGPDLLLVRSLCAAAFDQLQMRCIELDARQAWRSGHSGQQDAAAQAGALRLLCRDMLLCNVVPVVTNTAWLAGQEGGDELLEKLVHDLLASLRVVVVLNGQAQRIAAITHQYTGHDAVPVLVKVGAPDIGLRRRMWERHTGRHGIALAPGLCETLVNAYLFTEQQVDAVLKDAASRAILEGHASVPDALVLEACRTLGQQDQFGVAQEVRTPYRLGDIVLPPATRGWLREVLDYARNRHRVTEEWGFAGKHPNSTNLCVLFYGPSGTGKTMAASIIANELNLGLYKIDLANVLSKYVGETEKQLARLFDQAEAMNIVLFFDEAESLFGKRTEMRDAHDRYANLQTGFLLERIETYPGIVVMSTNLLSNLDSAFTRRFRFMIEYPFPGAAERLQLWRQAFPPSAPVDPGVDYPLLAERAPLSGGNISSIAMRAAFYAAAEEQRVSMAHILRATEREFDKLGKVFSERDFQWFDD
jgi:SpoVK/Ycf46/Vps4 family AAA+-type ATPase